MTGHARPRIVAIVCCGVLVAACAANNGGRATASHTQPLAPSGDFYTPPNPLPPRPAGTLIWAERVTKPTLNPPATIWRILYHSTDRFGRDVAVSGFALVPQDAGVGPRPVYAWAHGNQGQDDQCAPSRHFPEALPPYGGQEVAQRALVVGTDYDGLGTPGVPTYLDGVAEGHAVLDSVRAAAQLPHAGALGRVVIAGHSQGGGAALWAGQVAKQYAPELHIAGVVALAPAGDFRVIFTAFTRGSYARFKGDALIAADGLHAAYGARFNPALFLTPRASADLSQVDHECVDATIARWANQPATAAFRTDPFNVPGLARILDANAPGKTDPGVPILLAQGTRDEEIPPVVSADLHTDYCMQHALVNRRLYPGASHDGVINAAMSDVTAWITARYAATPAISDC